MTDLTGKQIEQFRDALLGAFDRSDLEQLVRIDLEENLEAIAGAGKLSIVVFELVMWAQRTGRVGELLAAAQSRRPTHAALAALAQELGAAPVARADALPATPGGAGVGKIEAVNVALGGTQFINQRGATFHSGGRTEIHTGGGAYVGGNVDTGGGAFVGHDQGAHKGAHPQTPGDLDTLLLKLAAAVALKASPATAQQSLAQVTVLQAELAKGKDADDARLAASVQALLAVAPDAVVAAFSTPALAAQVGPVTRFVLQQHGAS